MKKIILIILLSCLLGGTQLWGAKKLEADHPFNEYLKRMKEDPEYLTRLLMNQANENARQYQEESLEALANPTPVKAKTDFGSQSIDYSLVSNGFVPSDLLWWVLSIPFFISCIRQQNPLTVLSKIILRKVKQFNLPPPKKNEGFLHF